MLKTADRRPTDLKEIVEEDTLPEVRAENLRSKAASSRNMKWFGERAEEIRDKHSGKFIVVLGEELFVGDDSGEVLDQARAAHPKFPNDYFAIRLSIHRGPKIRSGRLARRASEE